MSTTVMAYPDIGRVPTSVDWTRQSLGGISGDPFAGTVQRISRPGGKWSFSASYPPLRDADGRLALAAFLARLQGTRNSFWLHHHGYTVGGLPHTTDSGMGNLLPALTDTASWTIGSSTTVGVSDSGRVSVMTDGVAITRIIAPVSVENARTYSLVVDYEAGKFTGTPNEQGYHVGTTSGAADIVAHTAWTEGRNVVSFTAAATTDYYVTFRTSQATAGDFAWLANARVARCQLVWGSGQTTRTVMVRRNNVTNLRAGAMVEINGELFELVEDMVDLGGGNGVYLLDRAPSAALSEGDTIILYKPSAQFMLTDNGVSYQSQPGILSNFNIDAVEV